MTLRYCPICKADVADAGGYCLLGHPVALDAPTGGLHELRAEVDQAFAEAAAEVGRALAGAGGPAATAPLFDQEESTPEPVTSEPVASGPQASGPASLQEVAPPAPPVARRGPPPPPPPPVYPRLDEEATSADDPIFAFAPPPRMDWGPNDRRTRPLRRTPEPPA